MTTERLTDEEWRSTLLGYAMLCSMSATNTTRERCSEAVDALMRDRRALLDALAQREAEIKALRERLTDAAIADIMDPSCDPPHDETSYDCWCEPHIAHVCSSCAGKEGGCYWCSGLGFKECEHPDACAMGEHVVNHRYPRGTPGACYFLKEPDDAV